MNNEGSLATILISNIQMLDNFNAWYVCRRCDGKLAQIATLPKGKCEICKTTMLVQNCRKSTSIRIAVTDPDDHQESIWLTLFSNELHVIINRYNVDFNTSISIDSPEDLPQAILSTANFTVRFDVDSNIIKSVTF